jgi:hypothetical protein
MTANDMKDALQNPHPELPFTHVGDATISALTSLAEISISTSLMPPPRQTRSQTTIHAQDITNVPLLPRVVTPMTRHPSPPRVSTRSQKLSPRNLSQDDFCSMDTAHMTTALGNHHWSQQHKAYALIHPITGKEMEYITLMKDSHLQPLWKRGFGNEVGRLFQGI